MSSTPALSSLAPLESALASTEHLLDLLAQILLAAHPDLEPDIDGADPAARSLLFAAEALTFALARYRCEHDRGLHSDPVPFAQGPRP